MYLLKSHNNGTGGNRDPSSCGYYGYGDGHGDSSGTGNGAGWGSSYGGGNGYGTGAERYNPDDAMVQLIFRLEVGSCTY